MKTAIVSDLHLGSLSGEDVLREESIRNLLIEEIGSADRLVLLGDIVELRDLPLAEALESTRPFFEALGEALGEREVIYLAGNHDHHVAEPLLERRALGERPGLGLENRYRPSAGAAQRVGRWLGPAKLEMAYPGVWLRDDVYAMHGHYSDAHLKLPRAECLAAAAMMRATGRPPDPAVAEDYERLLRPAYGLLFGLAQSGAQRRTGGASRSSEKAWRRIVGATDGAPGWRQEAAGAALRAGVPAAIWTVNRLLDAEFDPDLTPRSISRGGIAALTETARRMRTGAAHVITGHTHRAGPREDEEPWEIPGGGLLHNTGNWVFTGALHRPGAKPGPYWPGTVTWLEDEGPPRRVNVLAGHSADDLGGAGRRGRMRLSALASRDMG